MDLLRQRKMRVLASQNSGEKCLETTLSPMCMHEHMVSHYGILQPMLFSYHGTAQNKGLIAVAFILC